MKILSRYVLKEHVGPLVFALSALTSLLLLNYVAKQFGNLVGKGLPWTVIAEFFFLSIPFTVAMTLPMAVLISVLYAFSRLAGENEVTALRASGVSLTRLLIPVVAGATLIAIGMVAFNDQVLPRANHQLSVLLSDIQRKKPTFALQEQVINEVVPRQFFLRTNSIDESSNAMHEVTIYDFSNATARRTIYADSGTMAMSPDHRDLLMTLYDGYMIELPRNDPGSLQRLYFDVDRIRVPGVGNTLERSESRSYKSDREMSICEMEHEVGLAEAERAAARARLEALLGAAARQATTGERVEYPHENTTTDSVQAGDGGGLAGAYCALLAALGAAMDSGTVGMPEAIAAQTPGVPQDSAVPANRGSPRFMDRLPPSAGGLRESQLPDRLPPSAGGGLSSDFDNDPNDPGFGMGMREMSPGMLSGIIDATGTRIEETGLSIAAFDVEIHKKFALAAACVVFVLLGAPIALRFPRGGVGLVIGVSIAVFALYYVGLIAGEALANEGLLPAFAAMWLANIIFTIVGLLLLARMGREASTARGGDMSELTDSARAWFARQGRRVGLPLDRRVRRDGRASRGGGPQ